MSLVINSSYGELFDKVFGNSDSGGLGTSPPLDNPQKSLDNTPKPYDNSQTCINFLNMYKDCMVGVNDNGCKIFIDKYEKCVRYNNPEPL